jgi:hypothetical protein
MTRIGLLSDTHGMLDERVFEHFANCDEVWHAGDIGSLDVINKLQDFKPLRPVLGDFQNEMEGSTMSEKSDKLRAMLEKEKERRIKLNNRIEILERRIQEEDSAEVNEMVRTAKVTPEQLAALLRQSATATPNPAALSAVGATFEKEAMQMKIKKLGALLVSAALCAGMAAPAFAFEGEAAPVEQPVLPEVVEDIVTVTDETSGALTPEGNLTLVDDYHTDYSDGSGQQFITLVSKSGATFYLVIDRNAKGQQTVHFMNLVDEADLLSLMEEEEANAYTAEKEAAAQAEQDRLKAEEEAKKAAEEAAASGTEQPKENKVTKIASGFLGVVVLIALAAGGGFYFYHQQMQKKKAEKEALDPDANYTEDKGDFEIPTDVPDEDETPDEQDTEPI